MMKTKLKTTKTTMKKEPKILEKHQVKMDSVVKELI